MDFTFSRNASITATILLIAAVTQAAYTAMYVAEITPPRQLLWGAEGLLFAMMAAFAGAALAQAKSLHVGWSAIVGAAILNVVQVGVGLTMFGPFREVAEAAPETAPLAGSIVAFSFMVYNAAKVLLALAAIVFGLAKMNAGGKALGGLTVAIGAIAFISNTLSMALGRGFTEIPVAGGSGVLATILLAVCLFGASREEG
ncbi:MAG: thiamine biosynthesis protein ThiC [Pseudomonadota bacterium]